MIDPSTQGPVIRTHDLAFTIGRQQAVQGLSLAIERGELYGLIGPDGAGKTTLMRLLAGLLDPTRGTVHILEHDPRDPRSGVRERLGYMPQRYSLYGDLSVAENLRFFARLLCLDPETFQTRARRLLDLTRLAPFVDRRAEALSGGMYKKLALACVLLHEPEVLLLDEPTNGVDPISRGELWALLHEFLGRNIAIVVSTAAMDEAERCNRIGLMREGRILVEGRPDTLTATCPDRVLQVFRTGQDVDHVLTRHSAAVLGITPHGGGLRILVRQAAATRFEADLLALGIEFQPARLGFEDLYLSRTASPEHGGTT